MRLPFGVRVLCYLDFYPFIFIPSFNGYASGEDGSALQAEVVREIILIVVHHSSQQSQKFISSSPVVEVPALMRLRKVYLCVVWRP